MLKWKLNVDGVYGMDSLIGMKEQYGMGHDVWDDSPGRASHGFLLNTEWCRQLGYPRSMALEKTAIEQRDSSI